MARFKNVGPEVNLNSPAGFPTSLLVAEGGFVEVPGEVAEETDDAYIVGEDGAARAWPKAQWLDTSKAAHDIQNEEG